jgi:D-glycerate 3-kinase
MRFTEATWVEAMAAADLPRSARAEVQPLWTALIDLVIGRWRGQGGMLVVGLCGPQGSGKSTTAAALAVLLRASGARVAVLSIDDLYLGQAARRDLAAAVHPLFAVRGPPGTHDVALGLAVLEALARPGDVALPRFDKATDDPEPRSEWPLVEGPVDVVLFEGWCVGAAPEPAERLAAPVNALERDEDVDGVWRLYANDALVQDYKALFDRIDMLIQLRAPSFDAVLGWRCEQEHKLVARTGKGMSDAEIARFIQHYERLTRWIDLEMPARADVVVQLDKARRGRLAG